ncbi:hypothetical protein RSAG8_06272, partial [Rhizoctonia solani AG-8 WAC10335]
MFETLGAGRHDHDRPPEADPLPPRKDHNDMSSDLDYESDNSYEHPNKTLEFLNDPTWPSKALASLLEELENTLESNTQDLLPARRAMELTRNSAIESPATQVKRQGKSLNKRLPSP